MFKRYIIVAIVAMLLVITVVAQETFSSDNGQLSFEVPAGFEVTVGGDQFLIVPAGVTDPRVVQAGQINLVMLSPREVERQEHEAAIMSVLAVAESYHNVTGGVTSDVIESTIAEREVAFFLLEGTGGGERDEIIIIIALESGDKLGIRGFTVAGELFEYGDFLEELIASVQQGESTSMVANADLSDLDTWFSLTPVNKNNASQLQVISLTYTGEDEDFSGISAHYSGVLATGWGGVGFVRIWDGITGEYLHTMDTAEFSGYPVIVGPDAFAMVDSSNDIVIFDWRVAREIDRFTYDETGFARLFASDDGAIVLITRENMADDALLIDSFTGEVLVRVTQPSSFIARAHFAADNSQFVLVSASGEGTRFTRYDSATGEELGVFTAGDNDFAGGTALHPNGYLFYTLHNRLLVMDMDMDAVIADIDLGEDISRIGNMYISADSSLIFMADGANLLVLDGETYERITVLDVGIWDNPDVYDTIGGMGVESGLNYIVLHGYDTIALVGITGE